jgi:hypothetical protein|nr:DUF2505 family protein [Kofleriaceae bacterium]
MKLEIEDVFALPSCEAYERLYFDEDYNIALGAALRMGRALRRLDRTPERVIRHVAFEPAQDPGSPVEHLGTSRKAFIEVMDYDLRAHRGTWTTTPNVFADRVTNAGTFELAMVAGGVRRVVTADVRVRLFGFGGRVEKLIVGEIVKNYEKSTRFMREWIARRG